MAKVTVRPATRADIAAFSDLADKPTLRAWVGELDGRLIGMGGFAFVQGRWVAFSDLTEEARAHKMTLMRAAIRAFAAARDSRIRFIYAAPDPAEPGAVKWLRRLVRYAYF